MRRNTPLGRTWLVLALALPGLLLLACGEGDMETPPGDQPQTGDGDGLEPMALPPSPVEQHRSLDAPLAPVELPYAYDALEPSIDARTVEIHYSRHHAGYATKLLAALQGEYGEFSGKSLSELMQMGRDALPAAVRNNAAQVFNHDLYWLTMAPEAGGEPTGELAEAINAKWGGFAAFQEAFNAAAAGQFGSGWCWLTLHDGELDILATSNEDNAIFHGQTPLLVVDVWEHAYYLNYQNARGNYLGAWWDVVNWTKVAEFYATSK